MKRPVLTSFLATTTVAVIAAGVVLLTVPKPNGGSGGNSMNVASTGAAQVGGPFTLTDHTGKKVSEQDFAGRFLLVAFGFTYCPDVCPTELQVMSAALDKLGEKAKQVQPVFITIDPERDTAEQMASYVSNFHESMMGLTGSAEEIARVAKMYRVYYRKVDDPESSAGYTMDHSAIIYLMDKQGNFLSHFAFGTKFEDMAKRMEEAIDTAT